MTWVDVGSTDLFPTDEGRVVLVGKAQIAVFRLGTQWYATQNMCPHKRALVLASGILSTNDQKRPYVSCPMHKKNFDVKTGECLVPGEEDKYKLSTFDVKIEDGRVYLFIPPEDILNEVLGSARTIVTKGMLKGKPAVVTFEEAPVCGNKSLDW